MNALFQFLTGLTRSIAEHFVQFVMITIAVFLGFLADDCRGELVERCMERGLAQNVELSTSVAAEYE